MMAPATAAPVLAGPWYRQVTSDQWKAFLATYLGWMLDAFDFTILTFLVVDIQRSFTVNNALAGALGSVTLAFRVAGGIGSGTAADRWGRKFPLMFSILWYSVFAFLGGFSTSYRMLFAFRALFGIGMGGVWAAGMPLALEHWPVRLRGIASGMLQSGYSAGSILSTLAFTYIYPLVNRDDLGWRVMLWIGILPALLVIWIMSGVKESPVWLDRQRHLRDTGQQRDRISLAQLFRRDLWRTTLHTSLVMGAGLSFYYSIAYWYPTFLGQMHHRALPFLVTRDVGSILGNVACGRLSETSLGRRGAATMTTIIGLAMIPLFLFAASPALLLAGALGMGFFGAGTFGIIPTYLNERFPTAVRAGGAGFAYHVGAGIAATMPYVVGGLLDRGMALRNAMAMCIAGSGVLLVVLLQTGPETRGRTFHATDDR